MKRFSALILTAALALSLTACGGGGENTSSAGSKTSNSSNSISGAETKLTYEELLENATVMSGSELSVAQSNKIKMQQLIGNSYIVPGRVWSVETDYCILQPVIPEVNNGKKTIYEFGNFLYLNVYLPVETMAELTSGQEITVVGTITETGSEDMPFEGTVLPVNTIVMKDAYQCTEEDRLKYISGYDSSPETVMEMAKIFGNDGDNNVSWKENSFPYFDEMRGLFSVMSDEQIKDTMVGKWITIDYIDDSGDTRERIFYEDGTGIKQEHKDDPEEEYGDFYWSVENGLNIGYKPGEVRVTWQMYQASDDVLVYYDNDHARMVFMRGE